MPSTCDGGAGVCFGLKFIVVSEQTLHDRSTRYAEVIWDVSLCRAQSPWRHIVSWAWARARAPDRRPTRARRVRPRLSGTRPAPRATLVVKRTRLGRHRRFEQPGGGVDQLTDEQSMITALGITGSQR